MKKSAKSARSEKNNNSARRAAGTSGSTGKDAVKTLAKRAESAVEKVRRAEEAVVAAVRSASKAALGEEAAGPRKLYLKSKPTVKVTFRLPREAAPNASEVSLVGDFNGWDTSATPMKRLRGGSFTAVVELERGREYRFRYLIEGTRWENDWHADRYVENIFGGEDSVVTV